MRLTKRNSAHDDCSEKGNRGMKAISRAMSAVVLALVVSLAANVASAVAAPTPHWQIITQAAPTYFHAGDTLDFYEVVAVNNGAAETSGQFTLKDVLPPGLVVSEVVGGSGVTQPTTEYGIAIPMACTVSGTTAQTVECTAKEPVPTGDRVSAKISVEVPADAVGPLINVASISGGGAGEASVTTSTPVVDPGVKVPYGAALDVEVIGEEGNIESQGGGRPFAMSTIFATHVDRVSAAEECTPVGRGLPSTPGCAELVSASRNIELQLPAGLVGNATNVPRCPQERFQIIESVANCPASTQVGFAYLSFFGSLTAEQPIPIYNIEPPPGQPAEFGFTVGGQAHIPMLFHLRADGNYGLDVKLGELTSFDAVRIGMLSIWGVPAVEAHNEKRYPEGSCETPTVPLGCPAGAPVKPLLRMPTSCSANPLEVPTFTDSEGQPNVFVKNDTPAAIAPMGRCDRLKFAPNLEAHPTTDVADSPTGLEVNIHIPQNEEPNELATPDLKDTVMKLPPNLTVNPSAANGLEGCSPSQFGLTSPLGATPIRTTDAPAACPNAAKIGTVEINSRLLDQPLLGSVYLASPYDNPFRSLLALYIEASSAKSGIVVKLAGQVEIGAEGQLTTRFSESPQLPFEDFKLEFFGGPQATLKTPAVCRDYANESTLTPWSAPESGPPATSSNSFRISAAPGGGRCPTSADQQPNSPAFEAGSESPLAGAFSPFVLRLQREDGSQQFSSLTVALPPGLVGQLTGIPYCADSALAAAAGKTGAEERASASCPAASQVGVVNVGSGAGPSPYYVQGRAYLTGPYKGAPLGLAIITPAVAGPFDLGTVVVRSALEVDPYTAQVTVKSDPIPTELKGIPLDVRSLAVKMDRPNFTLNPTNCEVMSVGGSMTSTLGQTAKLANRFQAGGCDRLEFAPKLKLRLKGKTKRSGHPALKAVVTYPKGASANIARAQVGLPHSEFLDQGNLDKVCTQGDLKAGTCPAKSIYGRAKAWTPLLDKPLEGPVYLAVGFGYKLPALVADLNGQIRILLKGRVDTTKRKGIRNTFETVPDAPVSRFVLEMKGGPKYGLLENSENICRKKQKASVRFVAANGRFKQLRPTIGNDCKAGQKLKQKKHGKRGGRR